MKPTLARYALSALLTTLVGCSQPVKHDDERTNIEPHPAAEPPLIRDAALAEISGLAASHYSDSHFWVHNDSGGKATLYRITTTGALDGHLDVTGTRNTDWEDLAAFEKNGRGYFIIGDIGDNRGQRETIQLHIIAEPDPTQTDLTKGINVEPEYSLTVRYVDGSRDAEALAVDTQTDSIYILTKRDSPPRLYRLPLGSSEAPVVAELITELPQHPQPTLAEVLMDPRFGPYRYSPTSMDIDTAGTQAIVLSYHHVFVYRRTNGESWIQAFQKQPALLSNHSLRQAEAISFIQHGDKILFTSEAIPAPLIFISK